MYNLFYPTASVNLPWVTNIVPKLMHLAMALLFNNYLLFVCFKWNKYTMIFQTLFFSVAYIPPEQSLRMINFVVFPVLQKNLFWKKYDTTFLLDPKTPIETSMCAVFCSSVFIHFSPCSQWSGTKFHQFCNDWRFKLKSRKGPK